VVDLTALRVIGTIDTLDTSGRRRLRRFTAARLCLLCPPEYRGGLRPGHMAVGDQRGLDAERPTALAAKSRRRKVYAAIFRIRQRHNHRGARFRNLLFFDNTVSLTNGPYGGQNPPPNLGTQWNPPLNPALSTNVPPPTGLIVRKNAADRWLDDNQRDWTTSFRAPTRR